MKTAFTLFFFFLTSFAARAETTEFSYRDAFKLQKVVVGESMLLDKLLKIRPDFRIEERMIARAPNGIRLKAGAL